MAVGLEPVDEGRGIEAEDDVVGLRDEVLEIVGLSAGDIAVVEGVLQVALAAVDAVHMEPGFGKLEGVFAAQQSEAHDEITLCFIQHILPPRLTA